MRLIQFVNNRLQQMPYGLRVVSRVFIAFAILFPVITILSILPYGQNAHYSINGTSVTYNEFLKRGTFLPFFLIGIYSGILACGLIRVSRWSRPLCLLPFIVAFISCFFQKQPSLAVAAADYLIQVLMITLLTWYLFFRQPVKDYFAAKQVSLE
jgi:surface polysaccharide O-acyltransferase-like enzyme